MSDQNHKVWNINGEIQTKFQSQSIILSKLLTKNQSSYEKCKTVKALSFQKLNFPKKHCPTVIDI